MNNCEGPHTINSTNVEFFSRHQSWHFGLLAPRNTWWENAFFGAQISWKYGTWYSKRAILQFMCVGSWVGVTYLRYTVLTSPKKGDTAVHCYDPALSVLFMLVSRNVFHVVSALQSIVFIHFLAITDPHNLVNYLYVSLYHVRSFCFRKLLMLNQTWPRPRQKWKKRDYGLTKLQPLKVKKR